MSAAVTQLPSLLLLLLLLLLTGLGRTAHALEVCGYTGSTPYLASGDGVLEEHLEEGSAVRRAETCEMHVRSASPVSRIMVKSVMFNTPDCAQQPEQPCSNATDNYVSINGEYICACRSMDDLWKGSAVLTLKVVFRRTSRAAASFSVAYKVQSCNLTELKEHGGYDSVTPVLYDKAEAVCKNSSSSDKETYTISALCHFENGTWEAVPHCGPANPSAASDAVLQHWPYLFHSDDDEDGFPKELVGGLAFVLVILVVVVIGATIYTIKRRYKVIVIKRPSARGSSARSGGRGSVATGSGRAKVSAPDDDAESSRAAEERLLPPQQQQLYGPEPSRQCLPAADHEYATPFDPAVGTWSPPSDHVTVAHGLCLPPAPANGDDGGVRDRPQYFVLEPVTPATAS